MIPFSGLLGLLLKRGLVHVFSYFGSLLLSSVLFLISLFLVVQVPFLSIIEAHMKRKKPVGEETPKPIRVVEERLPDVPRERERKREREKGEKACPGVLRFLKRNRSL